MYSVNKFVYESVVSDVLLPVYFHLVGLVIFCLTGFISIVFAGCGFLELSLHFEYASTVVPDMIKWVPEFDLSVERGPALPNQRLALF